MKQAPILIIGEPAWQQTVQDTLGKSHPIQQQKTWDGYISTLIDHRIAMILLDTKHPNWQDWVSPPKASAATRRIPIVVITANPSEQEAALLYGADFTLSPEEIRTGLARLVANNARMVDHETQKQLDCDCAEALPTLAQEGIRSFNAGEYYQQHDLFEELWMQTKSPVRDLYRAILQVGIAYYQIERKNYRGALKMLQRSVQWLLILPDQCQGVDVQQLREDSFRVRAELLRLGPEHFDQFDHSLLKPVRLLT